MTTRSTFSFLYRNERTATRHSQNHNNHPYQLSVSSIGTNELQPKSHQQQYHYHKPFSFLYRNERTATKTEVGVTTTTFVFQFPLSERTNCNPTQQKNQHSKTRSFSFLYRNERTATRITARVNIARSWLSVSSIGTNELQLEIDLNRKAADMLFQFPLSERTNCNHLSYCDQRVLSIFQFPLSERTNCNLKTSRAIARKEMLSVSSIGTNELQLPRIAPHRRLASPLSVSSIGTNELQRGQPLWFGDVRTRAFSFLYRNERTATRGH